MYVLPKLAERSTCTLFLALLFFGSGSKALAGDLLIAGSTDPRHVVGTIIDADKPLYVDEGKSVTLLAQDGRKLRIHGPSHEVPSIGTVSNDGSILSALSRLLSRSTGPSTMAVFRGSPRDRIRYVIALDGKEPRCVSGNPQIRFAKPERTTASALSIASNNGLTVSVDWPAAENEIEWPSAMTYTDDAQYTVSLLGGQPKHLSIKLFTRPRDLPSEAHAVVWMADKGCERDAQRALRKLTR
jgi:hypothetical protein